MRRAGPPRGSTRARAADGRRRHRRRRRPVRRARRVRRRRHVPGSAPVPELRRAPPGRAAGPGRSAGTWPPDGRCRRPSNGGGAPRRAPPGRSRNGVPTSAPSPARPRADARPRPSAGPTPPRPRQRHAPRGGSRAHRGEGVHGHGVLRGIDAGHSLAVDDDIGRPASMVHRFGLRRHAAARSDAAEPRGGARPRVVHRFARPRHAGEGEPEGRGPLARGPRCARSRRRHQAPRRGPSRCGIAAHRLRGGGR